MARGHSQQPRACSSKGSKPSCDGQVQQGALSCTLKQVQMLLERVSPAADQPESRAIGQPL
eukprot:1146473-Pelagomonas_calceolata.AAC.8